MNLNSEDLKKQYKNNGFFVIKNFPDINPELLSNDILSVDFTEHFNDRYSHPRRVEKIYDKSKSLSKLNNDIIYLLENIFDEKMTFFQDKYNSKLPGGEVFYAHYEGFFYNQYFADKKNSYLRSFIS
tara:strand:+ start:242 stop:622 length:381 start_codon:yes stop_codon:yes gene_type:complete